MKVDKAQTPFDCHKPRFYFFFVINVFFTFFFMLLLLITVLAKRVFLMLKFSVKLNEIGVY